MVITMWALIVDGAVREVTDIDPSGRFHPSLEWVACDESVQDHMIYEDGGFYPSPESGEGEQE